MQTEHIAPEAQIPLSSLLAEQRDPSTPLAQSSGKIFTWGNFRLDVASLSSQILEIGIGRWLLFTEDTYLFTVGLFAIWHADSIAVLPHNLGQQTLKELNHDLKGVVTDCKLKHDNVPVLYPKTAVKHSLNPARSVLSQDRTMLEIFTSGSTGARKALKKTIGNLESEVEEQEEIWGCKLGKSTVFSTVSHQHIYGLLFKVLWPLHAGRVFQNETFFSPNELVKKMNTCKSACLVSGPAHLKRMPELIDLSEMTSRCSIIFSSGGPLSTETSRAFTESAGLTPYEILGSTETGGIAWRQQSSGIKDDVWKAFSKVEVALEPPEFYLKVRSPFFNEVENDGWFVTGDIAEMAKGKTFLLKGRGDRVVKIEGKRLSLAEMELRLESHSIVDTAKIFLREDHPFTQRRPPLAAVVVLNKSENINLQQMKIQKIIADLKLYLAASFDQILLPRSWKFVDRLPEDAQGKTRLADLQALLTKQKVDSK
jgi:acyl-coenzyme A synthetase/AMP-(fatty) acid ligase